MKLTKIMLVGIITSASLSYALDNLTLPIESQAKEVYVGGIWASYDDGSIQNFGPGFKFGLMPNLELGIEVPLTNFSPDHGSGEFGLNQVTIGAKYAFAPTLAGFVDFALPFGSSKIVDDNPTLNTDFGVLIDTRADQIHLRGNVSYEWIPENKDKYDAGNIFGVELRPGFQLNPGFEAFLDMTFAGVNTSAVDGTDRPGTSNWLFVAGPGALVNIDKTTRIEGLVDFLLLKDKDNGLNWALSLQFNKQL